MGTLRVTLPKQPLLTALAALPTSKAHGEWWTVAGSVRRTDGEEFLLPSLSQGTPSLADVKLPGASALFLVVAGPRGQIAAQGGPGLFDPLGIPRTMPVGLVSLSPDGAAGWIRREGSWVTVDEVRWHGAGMPSATRETPAPGVPDAEADSGRYSRLTGALGSQGHERLRGLRGAVIGVSRVGAEVATWMALMGLGRFDLVDPDLVEPHNADGGDFHPELDEGRNKAYATALRVGRLLRPGAQVRYVTEDLLSTAAISVVREADVIVTAVDDDGARMAASLLAASYMRVHLDIGTQVTRDPSGSITVGADVRLVLPDSPSRCLACFGGFAQPEDLRRLAGFGKEPRPHWQSRRAGSLRSLNRIAANAGLRLIERLVAGGLDRSMWIRYEEGEAPGMREIVPPLVAACPLCSPVSGIGDEVLHDWDLRIRRAVRALVGTGE